MQIRPINQSFLKLSGISLLNSPGRFSLSSHNPIVMLSPPHPFLSVRSVGTCYTTYYLHWDGDISSNNTTILSSGLPGVLVSVRGSLLLSGDGQIWRLSLPGCLSPAGRRSRPGQHPQWGRERVPGGDDQASPGQAWREGGNILGGEDDSKWGPSQGNTRHF